MYPGMSSRSMSDMLYVFVAMNSNGTTDPASSVAKLAAPIPPQTHLCCSA